MSRHTLPDEQRYFDEYEFGRSQALGAVYCQGTNPSFLYLGLKPSVRLLTTSTKDDRSRMLPTRGHENIITRERLSGTNRLLVISWTRARYDHRILVGLALSPASPSGSTLPLTAATLIFAGYSKPVAEPQAPPPASAVG